jgi:uncharacterized protein YjbI with pentapeptide repeats
MNGNLSTTDFTSSSFNFCNINSATINSCKFDSTFSYICNFNFGRINTGTIFNRCAFNNAKYTLCNFYITIFEGVYLNGTVFTSCLYSNVIIRKYSYNTIEVINYGFTTVVTTIDTNILNTAFFSCNFESLSVEAILSNISSSNNTGTITLPQSWALVSGYLLGPSANLSSMSLSGIVFPLRSPKISLNGANLSRVRSGGVQNPDNVILPSNYKILGGYLLGPDVDLTNAVIDSLNFTGVDLSGALLTNIRSRNITGTPTLPLDWKLNGGFLLGPTTNLTDMSLINLDLSNTNISNANLTRVRSSGLTFNSNTFLPKNYIFIKGVIVGPNTNLRGADFSNTDVSSSFIHAADFSNAIFTNARWYRVYGTPLNLNPEWSIVYGYLLGPSANCTGYNFTYININGLNLSQANLTNIIGGPFFGTPASIPSTWKIRNQYLLGSTVILNDANLSGQDLSGVNLSFAQINGANISGTNFTFANISNLRSKNLTGTPILSNKYKFFNQRIVGKNLESRSLDISGQNLIGIDLTDSDLSGSLFNNIDLSGTILARTNFTNSILKNLKITNTTELISTNFINCTFINSNFKTIKFIDTNFLNSDLSGADFRYSDLSGVNFTGCNLTNAKFTSANLRNISSNKTETYDKINTDGVYLDKSDLRQYRYIISELLSIQDFKTIDFNYFKNQFVSKQFQRSSDVLKSTPILLIKRTHHNLYEKLFNFYTKVSGGFENSDYFDTLSLEDVEIRHQIFKRSVQLIQDIGFSDDFLLNLVLLYPVSDMPIPIMRNINFDNCMYISCCRYFLKNLFFPNHQSFALKHPSIFNYTMEWLKEKTRIFYASNPDPTLFQKSAFKFDAEYQTLLEDFKEEMSVVEFYLYCKYTFTKYTSVADLQDTIVKMNLLTNKYGITPMVEKLYLEIIDKIFGPEEQRNNEDLYRLNIDGIIGNYNIERRIVQNFISKNKLIVDNVFQNDPKLAKFWIEFQNDNVLLSNLQELVPTINSLKSGINYFRKTLFTNCKDNSYEYIKSNAILDVMEELRNGNIEPLINTNDKNIDTILEYLNDDPLIRKMMENPEQLLKDIYQTDYASVQDLTKLYYFSKYSNSTIKDKILKYDIHRKINKNSDDELRYIRLFSGINVDVFGDEELITNLSEYQRVWNTIV